MTTESITNFIGKWELDPSQSAYEFGRPPLEGTYTIIYDGHRLHFIMDWKNEAGQSFQQIVEGVPDGEDHAYEGNPEFADAVCYTLVDASTLDSTAKKDGQVVAFARRILEPGGERMRIVQSGKTPEGEPFENLSIYRRVTPAGGG